MYATIGLPGSSRFCYKRFTLRGKALDEAVAKWRRDWVTRYGSTQEALNAARDGLLLSEREARAARWRDGRPIYVGYGSNDYDLLSEVDPLMEA